MPPPLSIGPVRLKSNLLLAPIAGYCDLAFRLICRSYNTPDGHGLGLACTDLLSPQGLLRGTATSLDLARTHDLDQPVGMQLYGADPDILAEGARWARDHGATVIDINMGCPVDKVTKKDGGSKLLCDPERAARVLDRVVAAVGSGPKPTPVTAKLRLGWFDGQSPPSVAEWLAPRLVLAGAAAITVHGRTTEQKFSGTVDLEGIRRVVEAVRATGLGVPVIGNGDVREPADALRMMRATGCDGVMIGRGALTTPWIFRDTWSLLTTGSTPAPPDVPEIMAMILRYFRLMLEFRSEHYAMTQIRRRISWFAKRLPPCKPLKEAIRLGAGPGDVEAALDLFRRGGLRSGSHDEEPVALADAAA